MGGQRCNSALTDLFITLSSYEMAQKFKNVFDNTAPNYSSIAYAELAAKD